MKRWTMGPKLRFSHSLLSHKWFVLRAGRLTGVPLWRLIIHDLSKFSPSEFGRYACWHHGPKDERDIWEWVKAWHHHLHRNQHHPEYYLVSWHGDPAFYKAAGVGEPVADSIILLPIPEVFVREMIADWHAASRTYTGKWDIAMWLNTHGPKMRLHDETIVKIDSVMHEIGYIQTDNCPWSYMAGAKIRGWGG